MPKGGVMIKRVLSLTVALILCLSMCVYAAPAAVNGLDAGNDSSILVLTNPQYPAVTAPTGELIVSGYCKSGASVNIYKLSPAGVYEITDYTMEIGASGIFFHKLLLTPGRNSFVLRAEMPDGRYQQIKFDVLFFGSSFMDYIKTF